MQRPTALGLPFPVGRLRPVVRCRFCSSHRFVLLGHGCFQTDSVTLSKCTDLPRSHSYGLVQILWFASSYVRQ
jgi:hypothetical protein